MAKPILLYTQIWAHVAEEFTTKVMSTPESEPINIWINSPGGSVDAGWSMLAILQDRKEVNMKVMGDASSMAFFMLLFATHVTVIDTVTPTIHRAAGFDESELTDSDLAAIIARNVVIRKKMEARIDEVKFTKVTGKTFDDIFSMKGRLNVQISAEQGVEIGLFDEIISIDVAKKKEIEGRFFNEIAALADPEKPKNKNSKTDNNMGLFTKDPIFLGKIDENQFAYGKLEVGARIKSIGEGEKTPINGIFEANNKTATIVNDEITAVVDIDTKQKQIDALTEKITELTTAIAEIGEKPEIDPKIDNKDDLQITNLTKQVEDLSKIIANAKLSVSNPVLPEREFDQEKVIGDTEMTRRERFAATQQEAYEAKQNERENS